MGRRRAIEILRLTERITEEVAKAGDVAISDEAVETLTAMLQAAPPAPKERAERRRTDNDAGCDIAS